MNFNLIKKIFLIIIGIISLALGFTGIFLPVLPTTPFLLLASFCFLKSSQKMYNWLINHKLFGKYIYIYLTYKAINKETKIKAIIFLWTMLIISMIVVDILHLRIFLVIVGICVTIHLSMLKTLTMEEINEIDDKYKSLQTINLIEIKK